MTLVGTLEMQAEALEREAAAFRKLIEAARDLGEERVAAILAPMASQNGNGGTNGNGHVATADVPLAEAHDDDPRGREAIRRIVGVRPGVWALAEIRVEMKRRGWFTSNKGVDVAVTRMCRNGEARRVGKGRYEFGVPVDGTLL